MELEVPIFPHASLNTEAAIQQRDLFFATPFYIQ